MVYRMNDGLGAAKPAPRTAKDAQKQEKAELRRAIAQAEDEWKRYINSLNNLVSQLRNGSLPSSTPLPSAPASDQALVPHLSKAAQEVLQKKIPTAYQIAQKLDATKGVRDAVSSYAAGQPPVSPGGALVQQGVPGGDLPGEVQQFVTVAAGATPALRQSPPGAQGAYVGPRDGVVAQAQAQAQAPGGPSRMRTILIVAGVGLAAFLAYRWWRGRGRK